jgi:para-aminobenzoate synthetase/4-amino-4-deoxychorismate lyase
MAKQPILEAHSEFVRFKTTRRAHYDAFTPSDPSVFDTILWNSAGEITEGTRGNLAFCIEGRWITPPLACGLLSGIGRAEALKAGRVVEGVVRLADLERVTEVAFVNSLRGWLPAQLT